MSKQLKGIKIEVPEKLDNSERKWTDSQYLDKWVNTIQLWLIINVIDLDGAEALEVVAFTFKGSTLATCNHFRRDKDKTSKLYATTVRDFMSIHQ